MGKIECCSGDNCRKAFEDQVNACKEYKKDAREYKEFGDNQRKKVKEFRELNSKLHDDIFDLEIDIKEKDEFVTKLTRERNKLQAEVKFYVEKIELKNQDIVNIEENEKKQKEAAQKFFKKIMDENDLLKKQLDDANKDLEEFKRDSEQDKSDAEIKEKQMLSEIDILEKEVVKIQMSNAEKETILEKLEGEKKDLLDKILTLETENESIKTENQIKSDIKNPTTKSLEEELNACGVNILSTFKCKFCDNKFLSKDTLQKHVTEVHKTENLRKEVAILERQIVNQRINLKNKILYLREKELGQTVQCKCRSFCRIFHFKHSWIKSYSRKFEAKLDVLNNSTQEERFMPSDSCEKNFPVEENLERYETTKHAENFLRGAQSGEVINHYC